MVHQGTAGRIITLELSRGFYVTVMAPRLMTTQLISTVLYSTRHANYASLYLNATHPNCPLKHRNTKTRRQKVPSAATRSLRRASR